MSQVNKDKKFSSIRIRMTDLKIEYDLLCNYFNNLDIEKLDEAVVDASILCGKRIKEIEEELDELIMEAEAVVDAFNIGKLNE